MTFDFSHGDGFERGRKMFNGAEPDNSMKSYQKELSKTRGEITESESELAGEANGVQQAFLKAHISELETKEKYLQEQIDSLGKSFALENDDGFKSVGRLKDDIEDLKLQISEAQPDSQEAYELIDGLKEVEAELDRVMGDREPVSRANSTLENEPKEPEQCDIIDCQEKAVYGKNDIPVCLKHADKVYGEGTSEWLRGMNNSSDDLFWCPRCFNPTASGGEKLQCSNCNWTGDKYLAAPVSDGDKEKWKVENEADEYGREKNNNTSLKTMKCPHCGSDNTLKAVDSHGGRFQIGSSKPTDLWECNDCASSWMTDPLNGDARLNDMSDMDSPGDEASALADSKKPHEHEGYSEKCAKDGHSFGPERQNSDDDQLAFDFDAKCKNCGWRRYVISTEEMKPDDNVPDIVGRYFPGFNLSHSRGYWQGKRSRRTL